MTSTPEQSTEAPMVLSAQEVAEAWGVAVSTVCRWADEGQIPFLRKMPGRTGQYIFPREALPGGRPTPIQGP
jgi:excisionase family DNA binding protein